MLSLTKRTPFPAGQAFDEAIILITGDFLHLHHLLSLRIHMDYACYNGMHKLMRYYWRELHAAYSHDDPPASNRSGLPAAQKSGTRAVLPAGIRYSTYLLSRGQCSALHGGIATRH